MIGFIVKSIPFIILGYIIFYQINKRFLRQKVISGIFKSKFVEKDSVIKTHFNSALSYFKEKEKYFVTIEIGSDLVTEQVDKDTYSLLKIGYKVKLIKHYTQITNRLIKITISQ